MDVVYEYLAGQLTEAIINQGQLHTHLIFALQVDPSCTQFILFMNVERD